MFLNYMFKSPCLDEDTGANLGGGGTPTETAGQQTDASAQQPAEQQIPQAIKVKFNHEEREIPYEEAVNHIQKGMNYEKAVERARQEARDSWVVEQGYMWHDKPITTEAEYKQALQEQELENKIRQQYANVPDEIVNELVESKRFREETFADRKTRESKEAETKQYEEFLTAYPDIDPKTIPGEVWAMNKQGKPLLDAYVHSENKNLKNQLNTFQTKEQTQQANQANAASSTGSVRGGVVHDIITEETINAHANDTKWMMKNYDRVQEFYAKKKG
jgi:hypothetical protein